MKEPTPGWQQHLVRRLATASSVATSTGIVKSCAAHTGAMTSWKWTQSEVTADAKLQRRTG